MAKKPSHRTIDISKLSKDVLALNPHLTSADSISMPVEQRGTAPGRFLSEKEAQPTARRSTDGPQPNKTEARFREYFRRTILTDAEIHFSPLTLRIKNRRYTPDWVLWAEDRAVGRRTLLIEIKGPYKWEDAILKYDLFKAHYNDRFDFVMYEEVDRVWRVIR